MAGAWNWRWVAKWATLLSLWVLGTELTVDWLLIGSIGPSQCDAAVTVWCDAAAAHVGQVDLNVGLAALVVWVGEIWAFVMFWAFKRALPEWQSTAWAPKREQTPTVPHRAWREFLATAVVVSLVALVGVSVYSVEYPAALCNDDGACGFYPNAFEIIGLLEQTSGTCAGASYFKLALEVTNNLPTTGDFGLSLTLQGASATTPPGVGGSVSRTSCGVSPPTSGWVAFLTSWNGVGEAFFDANGWHSWNQSIPINLYGGGSLTILSSTAGSPVLPGAQIDLYPTNGVGVNGHATL